MRAEDREEPITPGWYQAPGETARDRYWDGAAWTADSRPRSSTGLQPAPPHLIVHDSGRHPLPWLASALGVTLFIAALISWGLHQNMIGTLLALVGAAVLGVSTALLQMDLSPHGAAIVSVGLGVAVLVMSLVAALAVSSVAWVMVASAIVLLVVCGWRFVRTGRGRRSS